MEACSYQAVELILGLSATAENTIARWGSRPEAWSRYSAIPRSSVLNRGSTAFVATACGRSHSTVLHGLLVTPATHWEERPRLDNLTARRDDLEGVFPQFWWICHAWLCFGPFWASRFRLYPRVSDDVGLIPNQKRRDHEAGLSACVDILRTSLDPSRKFRTAFAQFRIFALPFQKTQC